MASSVQSPLADARATQSEKSSWREGRKSIYLVSSSTNAGMTSPESEIPGDQIGLGSATPISTDHQAEDCASPSLDTDRSNHRHWLRKPWSAAADRWTQWRREREIKRAVAALEKFDDQTLRDIGIPDRSEIERVIRYCRDC